MENIALIGIDLGKNSFHIHCQDRRGKAVYRKKFTRPKLIEFWTCPLQPSQWKPVAVLTLWHASWKSWGIPQS
ncbi:Putative transposase (identified by ISEscan HMM) [Klebsiella pneumoniae]|nr:Putative transposase (identified by ISEscan HMM) [Klebsiella pneumoniae]